MAKNDNGPLDEARRHPSDPEIQKRNEYKDRLVQRIRKIEADAEAAKNAPPAAKKGKKILPEAVERARYNDRGTWRG